MRVPLEMRVELEEWKDAAVIANNLSRLALTLGEMAAAVGCAEQAMTYADRTGDPVVLISMRTHYAWVTGTSL